MAKDYRVTIKVRNNRILQAIEEAGGTPGGKWCADQGLCYEVVNRLINMTDIPIKSDGTLTKTASRLCEVLGKLPDDLWSAEQLYPLEKNFASLEMDYEQVVAMLPAEDRYCLDDHSRIEQEQTKEIVMDALRGLHPLQREVIRMRYECDLSQTECGELLGVSKDRIRQIEEKAMRKLRGSKTLQRLAEL